MGVWEEILYDRADHEKTETNLNQCFYELTQNRNNSVSHKKCIFMKLKNKLYSLCVIKEETENQSAGKSLESSSNRMSTKHFIEKMWIRTYITEEMGFDTIFLLTSLKRLLNLSCMWSEYAMITILRQIPTTDKTPIYFDSTKVMEETVAKSIIKSLEWSKMCFKNIGIEECQKNRSLLQ